MISRFTIENLTTQQKATFGQEPSCDYLYKSDGLDWGTAKAKHNTYTYPGQIGVSISSTNVQERSISIVGYACYVLTQSERESMPYNERVEYGYQKILEKKEFLSALVNPSQYVRIAIGEYYIDGKPSSSIAFGKTEDDNNQYFCRFAINIYCADPLFKKQTNVQTILSDSIPQFHFPLIFSQNHGIIMSIKREYKLIAIENNGAVPVGCTIIFEAKGRVVNPKLENIQTGESLVIDKTMVADEKIVITTVDGDNKGVKGYINDVEYNYFKYWNFENDWMKFPRGISLIGYSVEEGDESSLNVMIEINPMKYSLEEM